MVMSLFFYGLLLKLEFQNTPSCARQFYPLHPPKFLNSLFILLVLLIMHSGTAQLTNLVPTIITQLLQTQNLDP